MLKTTVGAQSIQDLKSYRNSIQEEGLRIDDNLDLSKVWRDWTKKRAANYQKMLDVQIKKYGAASAQHMLEFYHVVAGLFAAGAIGGVAIWGTKP